MGELGSWHKLASEAAGRAQQDAKSQPSLAFTQRGEAFVAHRSGALYWPAHKALLVADLHLEKGSSFARRGQFLPPYDSEATLAQLESDLGFVRPQKVICLGDSFHDGDGPHRLAPALRDRLERLTTTYDWLWITGNHDPQIGEGLSGHVADQLILPGEQSSVTLCHEPSTSVAQSVDASKALELCGHLHPVTSLRLRGRILRRKCFVLTQGHIILPAYGSYTGGLDVRDKAFTPVLAQDVRLLVIGRKTLALHRLN